MNLLRPEISLLRWNSLSQSIFIGFRTDSPAQKLIIFLRNEEKKTRKRLDTLLLSILVVDSFILFLLYRSQNRNSCFGWHHWFIWFLQWSQPYSNSPLVEEQIWGTIYFDAFLFLAPSVFENRWIWLVLSYLINSFKHLISSLEQKNLGKYLHSIRVEGFLLYYSTSLSFMLVWDFFFPSPV